MPDPYERHARSSENDWGGNAPRGASRRAAASDEAVKRPPGKKDPDLCKALHWKGPHVPVMRVHEYTWRPKSVCRWTVAWSRREPEWHCAHEEVCSGCGKVLTVFVGADRCPDYHPVTAAEEAEAQREIERWALRRFTRPVIRGPQGYRKPKKEKDA